MENIKKEHQPHIVEFGCATGLLLSLINKKGYINITGVDPSPSCAETAKKYYGINVLTNTLSDVNIDDDSVDFLILVGVLEHIKDLDDSLAILWRMLAPKGKICIIVPDASQYFNGQDAPFQEFSVEHINFFGPVSLGNLMKKNGFSKVDISQMPVEVNYKTITPVICSVFEKNHLSNQERIIFDKDVEVKQTISTIADRNIPIMVWGTGAQTLRLLAISRLKEANIIAFIDSNPKYQGKHIEGIPVISPQNITGKTETILICTRAYQEEIARDIRNVFQLDNEIIKLY